MSIRFASIGTGWIAGEFLKGAREVEGLEYTACYSRSQEKGEEFAKQWGAQKVYTDLEAMAEADTIVFDKTGTLTKAKPTVVDVVPFDNNDPEEMLRIAACMEEHFPHSMAKAVVSAARKKHLAHEEMHSKVEYVHYDRRP